jgi:hypothetical protein
LLGKSSASGIATSGGDSGVACLAFPPIRKLLAFVLATGGVSGFGGTDGSGIIDFARTGGFLVVWLDLWL